MTDADRRVLQELKDRSEIRDLVLRYARGVDRRDLDLVASCFTPDASYEGALSSTGISDALATLGQALARYDSTFHLMGNHLVELRGDEAEGETYAVAYHRSVTAGCAEDLVVAVRYLDQLIRQTEGWRIRRRQAVTVWTRREPVPPDAAPTADPAAPSTRSRASAA